MRKNEAPTAATLTIPASGVAGRRCVSSTISYAGGDTVAMELVNNASGSSAAIANTSYESTPTAAGMTALLLFPKQGRTLTASASRYSPLHTAGALTTVEDDAWAPLPRAGTMKNLRCYLKTAGANDATVTVYKNGIATALTLTLDAAGGNDRVISDTVNTVVFAKLDSTSLEWTAGASTVPVSSGCTVEYD